MRIIQGAGARALILVLGLAAMAPTCCPKDKDVLAFDTTTFANAATCDAQVQSLCPAANNKADAECVRYCSEGKEDGCKGTVVGRQAPHVYCTNVVLGLNPQAPAPLPPGPVGTCTVQVSCHCSS